jgi:hypothetical protein
VSILGSVKKLFLPSSSGQVVAASPAEATSISRRKFFSFFGTGVALLAAPDLLLPSTNRFGVSGSNVLPGCVFTPGLKKELLTAYQANRKALEEILVSFRNFKDTEGQPIWDGPVKEFVYLSDGTKVERREKID